MVDGCWKWAKGRRAKNSITDSIIWMQNQQNNVHIYYYVPVLKNCFCLRRNISFIIPGPSSSNRACAHCFYANELCEYVVSKSLDDAYIIVQFYFALARDNGMLIMHANRVIITTISINFIFAPLNVKGHKPKSTVKQNCTKPQFIQASCSFWVDSTKK